MLLLAIIGLIDGIFINLLGPGGGVLATPLLYYCLHMSFIESNFIASLLVLIICTIYSFVNLKHRNLTASFIISGVAIFTNYLGIEIATILSANMIRLLFSIITLIIAVTALINLFLNNKQYKTIRYSSDDDNSYEIRYNYRTYIILIVLGLLSGLLSGLLGIGGGFFIIPVLSLLPISKTIIKHIAFSSVAIILLYSLPYKFFYHDILQNNVETMKTLYFISFGLISFILFKLWTITINIKLLVILCSLILIVMSYFEFIQFIRFIYK